MYGIYLEAGVVCQMVVGAAVVVHEAGRVLFRVVEHLGLCGGRKGGQRGGGGGGGQEQPTRHLHLDVSLSREQQKEPFSHRKTDSQRQEHPAPRIASALDFTFTAPILLLLLFLPAGSPCSQPHIPTKRRHACKSGVRADDSQSLDQPAGQSERRKTIF